MNDALKRASARRAELEAAQQAALDGALESHSIEDTEGVPDQELSRRVLRSVASGANKKVWMSCKYCKKKSEVEVRDSAAVVAAAKALAGDDDGSVLDLETDVAKLGPAQRIAHRKAFEDLCAKFGVTIEEVA